MKDTAAAKTGYGPYVEPVSVDINSNGELTRVLKNVRCVVVLGQLGGMVPAAQKAGVERLVLLSTAGRCTIWPSSLTACGYRTARSSE